MVWKKIMDESAYAAINRVCNRTSVNEMALPLKVFVDRIGFLQFQMIENWCLVKYCQMFDDENIGKMHWVEEFTSYAKRIQNFELKWKLDKKKILTRELIEYDDLDEARKTIGIIKDKFESEGIDDIDKIKSVSEEFATNIESLIEMLANEIELKEYVKTTFNID